MDIGARPIDGGFQDSTPNAVANRTPVCYHVVMAVTEALDRVAGGLQALAAIDLDALTDAELHDLVMALPKLADRITAVAAPALQRWDARRGWAADGSKSAAARLSRDTGRAKRTAAAEVRRARALTTMPLAAAAATAGELSLDQVDLLVGVNTSPRRELFTEHEQTLIGSIRGLRYAHACRAVRYWAHRADAALGCDDTAAEQHHDANRLQASETLDGMVAIDGLLDPVGGTIVVTELDRLIKQLQAGDEAAGVTRTVTQLRAAALVEMARRSATMPSDGRSPKPLFTVLIGEGRFPELCELANGTIITPAHLTPFMTDAMLEVVLFDGPTTIVSVSRKRTFTGALRRAIEVRDRHCQHPAGCDEPASRCDVDHTVPHSLGGLTSQSNGRLECETYNRNSDLHDHHATPHPERTVTRLDELRARIRWRMRRTWPDELRDPDERWPDNPWPDIADTG